MTFSVKIAPSTLVPSPGLPRDISQPVHLECTSLEAYDWTWDGQNVMLVSVPGVKTLREQIDRLKAAWHQTGLRPLRADEFVQLYEHSENWPVEWKDLVLASRIFFPGTEYKLIYPDEVYQRVFGTRYDHEVQDWLTECEDTNVVFGEYDRIACIYEEIRQRDDPSVTWSQSFERRRMFVAHDRPLPIRNRYYPGIEV